ncbi:hypothetical protein [Streptomyces scabiei]|uniref:hypothetical protein n=1 Tax=Streptomyces scabiei TaxID=1930 RepID=UPI0038F6796C
MDPFVPKREERRPGDHTCGYQSRDMKACCGRPATWHVLWDAALDNSVACDEHMELTQSRWVYVDRHPVVADCTMPGALWNYPDQRCEFPLADPTADERVIEEAVGQLAEQAGVPRSLLSN